MQITSFKLGLGFFDHLFSPSRDFTQSKGGGQMKIKFAGLEVDDKMTVGDLCRRLEVETVVYSFNREPTAQEVLDQC